MKDENANKPIESQTSTYNGESCGSTNKKVTNSNNNNSSESISNKSLCNNLDGYRQLSSDVCSENHCSDSSISAASYENIPTGIVHIVNVDVHNEIEEMLEDNDSAFGEMNDNHLRDSPDPRVVVVNNKMVNENCDHLSAFIKPKPKACSSNKFNSKLPSNKLSAKIHRHTL